MKRHTPQNKSAAQNAGATAESGRGVTSRRQFFGSAGNILAAGAIASATVNLLAPTRRANASNSAAPNQPSPEIKLIDDYNAWFYGTIGAAVDVDKIRREMPAYITDATILNEALSLPWGGTTVGFDGWVHLCQVGARVNEKLAGHTTVSEAQYTQRDKVVFREMVMTIKAMKGAAAPFLLPIVEKYRIENTRISRIDSYFQDTAGFVARLHLLGAFPKRA